MQSARKRKRRYTVVASTCQHCGGGFNARVSDLKRGGRRGQFCSRGCANGGIKRRSPFPLFGPENPNWKGGFKAADHVRKFRRKFPQKAQAYSTYRYALRSGKLVRPGHCENCGVACVPHGHHDDYSKPLEVRWLCQSCHLKHHHELRRSA